MKSGIVLLPFVDRKTGTAYQANDIFKAQTLRFNKLEDAGLVSESAFNVEDDVSDINVNSAKESTEETNDTTEDTSDNEGTEVTDDTTGKTSEEENTEVTDDTVTEK